MPARNGTMRKKTTASKELKELSSMFLFAYRQTESETRVTKMAEKEEHKTVEWEIYTH